MLAWNAAHGWASFAKQGGRTGDWHPYERSRFLGELVGEPGGPRDAPGVLRLRSGHRRGRKAQDGIATQPPCSLALVTLVPAAVFIQHALGGRVQANWPAIIAPGAALAARLYAPRFWRSAASLGLAMAIAVFVQAAFAPLALPRALDFTLIRLAGWSDLAGAAYVARLQEHADFVAADEYGLASELAFRMHGDVVSQEARWTSFDLPRRRSTGRRESWSAACASMAILTRNSGQT